LTQAAGLNVRPAPIAAPTSGIPGQPLEIKPLHLEPASILNPTRNYARERVDVARIVPAFMLAAIVNNVSRFARRLLSNSPSPVTLEKEP
jgi:hypothetical protein